MPETKTIARRESPNAGFYRDVLLCCIPLLAMSYAMYGLRPVILAVISCCMAYVCDRLLAPLHGPGYEPNEMSSQCFAVLLTLLMPATCSAYVLAVAVLATVLIGKEVFGGIGSYPFHPAAVGYVIAAVAWPDEVFRYPAVGQIPIFGTGSVELFQSASATMRNGGVPSITTIHLLIGDYAGPLGACFTLIILSCGIFLLYRRRIHLTTTLSFLAACALVAWVLPRIGTSNMPTFSLPWQYLSVRFTSLKYELLSGCMLFASIFLICEPVTQPKESSSRVVYGFLLGILTMMFRYYGVYETGVCFALLILNALSDRLDFVVARVTGRAKPHPVHRAPAAQKSAPAVEAPKHKPAVEKATRPAAAVPEPPKQPKPVAPVPRKKKVVPDTTKTLMIPNLRDLMADDSSKEVRNGKR